jgi:Ras-related protein Rab-8A
MTTTQIARPMRATSTEYDVLAKAIVIGDSSVGKSSLLYRYTEQDWNPHYIATIGVDFKVMTFERNNRIIKMQLWDTAGQDRFRTIVHTYYRGAHAVMLIFALDDRASFENLSEWMADVQRFGSNGVPVVLIGNKADTPADQIVVADEEAEALASRLGGVYMKTSARLNQGVDEAFTAALEKCLEFRLSILDKQKDAAADKNRVRLQPMPQPKKANDCPC